MAKLEGGAQCAKILMIIFNILFFIVGIALLAVGIWVVTSPYKLEVLAILDSAVISGGAYFIIALGVFIFVVSFLGCCGAWTENRLMLIVYFIIVLLVFIAQLIGCCIIIAYKDKVDTFVTENLQKTMEKYEGLNATDKYSVGWNSLQILLECCGTNNYTDWADTDWYRNQTTMPMKMYPETCCTVEDNLAVISGGFPAPLNATGCYSAAPNAFINSDGCYMAFEEWVIMHALYIGGVGLGLAFLEIFAMVFAICMCRGISKLED